MNREVHICTVCGEEMKAHQETTTLCDVTYHTRCFRAVDMTPSEEPHMEPTTDN